MSVSESSNNDERKKYSLKTVDFLLGTNTKIENVIVLGMLTMLKHGIYSLEDPTGRGGPGFSKNGLPGFVVKPENPGF